MNALAHDLFTVSALPVQLAVPPVTDIALLVDQIDTGPHRIPPSAPVLVFIVDNYREFEPRLFHFLPQSADFMLDCRFGCVDSDNREILVGDRILPTPVPGVIALAVNSAKRPKMQGDHVASQVDESLRLGVDPAAGIDQFRRLERDVPQL